MLTITLSSEIEGRLQTQAERAGVDIQSFASTLLEKYLERPSEPVEQLFAKWAASDPVTGPEDLKSREAECEAFMSGLAQARRDMEGPNARNLWPSQGQ